MNDIFKSTLSPSDITEADDMKRVDVLEDDPQSLKYLRNFPKWLLDLPELPKTPGDYKWHVSSDGTASFVNIVDEVTGLPEIPKENGKWELQVTDKGGEWVDASEGTKYTFTHSQTSPSDIWVINHNLNCYPSITVTDYYGAEIDCDKIYTDSNCITLKFASPFIGYAHLN